MYAVIYSRKMSNLTLYILALIVVLVLLLIFKAQTNVSKVSQPASVLLFYRDGCPFCEVFKPEWTKVEQALKGRAKKFNTSDPKIVPLANQYKVSGVPTIVLLDANGGYETYLGSRNADDIIARF